MLDMQAVRSCQTTSSCNVWKKLSCNQADAQNLSWHRGYAGRFDITPLARQLLASETLG